MDVAEDHRSFCWLEGVFPVSSLIPFTTHGPLLEMRVDLCSLPRTPDLGEVSTGMATSPFPQPNSPSLCTRSSLPIREIPLLPLSLYCFQEGWDPAYCWRWSVRKGWVVTTWLGPGGGLKRARRLPSPHWQPSPQVIGLLDVFTPASSLRSFHDL